MTALAFLLWGIHFPAAAQKAKSVSLDDIKQLIVQKKVSEAVEQLKSSHRGTLKSPAHQKQVAEWLSAFQYDSTLGLFEKTLELMMNDGDPSVIEKNLQNVLEKEPYNVLVLLHSVKFMVQQQQNQRAREKIVWAQGEMPYMEIYRVMGAWLDVNDKLQVGKNSCDHPTLNSAMKDFCFYVKVLEDLQEKNLLKTDRRLSLSLSKTNLPNKYLALWKKWQKDDDLQKYLSSCAAMSGKQKKIYLFVPDFCKVDEKDTRE